MKRLIPIFLLTVFLTSTSCIINNPQPGECDIEIKKIVKITEGSSYDIVFKDENGDPYYIYRGLEMGLNLKDLNASVLNKTVTLHLPRLFFGASEPIAQLAIGDKVIFTEFD